MITNVQYVLWFSKESLNRLKIMQLIQKKLEQRNSAEKEEHTLTQRKNKTLNNILHRTKQLRIRM